jgi:predicted phage terminase large subunit-like protein
MYSEVEVKRAWAVANPLNFTRYFFHAKTGKRFIIGKHHRIVCDALKGVLDGSITRLIINIAPRYSKTELAVKNFIAMGLGINPAARFIHLSYSGILAQDNSIAIKDILKSPEYQELFAARIKFGSDTKTRWDTEQGGGVYATSTLGQITGFGAGAVEDPDKPYQFSGAIVIDDPIKPEDALSDVMRERVNRRFETTIRSRVNSRETPIIIIMQRLHENDLCGYLTENEKDKWKVISLPCIWTDEDNIQHPLWKFKHTMEELRDIEKANKFVFDTQYMQKPTPLEGLMYTHFQTYQSLPLGRKNPIRKAYIDTADTGADFLCAIYYNEYEDGCYVTEVLYTDKPMEYTEPETAKAIIRNNTQIVTIDSNNGGRSFRRNVEKLVRSMENFTASFNDLSQTQNKQSRIFSHANEVQNMIFFPENWDILYPAYNGAMKAYRKEGGNLHDDAPDATTGVVEMFGKGIMLNKKKLARLAY